jgi:hypothetical protein
MANAQMLLDPFEKQFDLPALLIERGDGQRGFVARICRISPDVLNKIDEGRFQPGVLSCLSNII